jgi:hypothetical protein
MRIPLILPVLATSLVVVAMTAAPAAAQPIGTFRWQLQPHCNVLSLTVTQVEGVYRLEGTDDQCGAGRARASVLGLAFQNPNGAIGLGMTIVTAPGGVAVHVDAEITLTTLSGTWRDNAGGQGAFVFTPGAPTPGDPLPAPAANVPPSISLLSSGGIVALAEGDSAIPASGGGTRLMWYPAKAAFRAGRVGDTRWDDVNVGTYSTALGNDTQASGLGSTALGVGAVATGGYATALGFGTLATGAHSTAVNRFTKAPGDSALAAGSETTASGDASAAFGAASTASGNASVAMGRATLSSGDASMAIGSETRAAGARSVAGGLRTQANGVQSFAFGEDAVANGARSVVIGRNAVSAVGGTGSFVFADASSQTAFTSFAPNEFVVRAAGGIGFYTNAATTTGAEMAPGGGSWAALSDANMKENFRDISGEDVLERLASMPVREWNYISQDAAIRHMGPTAQDFRAAFGLGDFPLRINTTDADGVALAAIKALETRTRVLGEENASLRAALERQQGEFAAALEALREQLARR